MAGQSPIILPNQQRRPGQVDVYATKGKVVIKISQPTDEIVLDAHAAANLARMMANCAKVAAQDNGLIMPGPKEIN